MTTQHHVGQVAKAEILVAHLLDTAPADADHERCAKAIVAQLVVELGWSPPRDPTAVPPLRPERIATQDEIRAHRTQIDAAIADAQRRITTVTQEPTQ